MGGCRYRIVDQSRPRAMHPHSRGMAGEQGGASRSSGVHVEDQGTALAQDLLDSIFRVASELVRGERASLMLRDDEASDFVISRSVGLAEDVRRQVRVRIGEGIAGKVAAEKKPLLAASG